jgi:hypothetical protein
MAPKRTSPTPLVVPAKPAGPLRQQAQKEQAVEAVAKAASFVFSSAQLEDSLKYSAPTVLQARPSQTAAD